MSSDSRPAPSLPDLVTWKKDESTSDCGRWCIQQPFVPRWKKEVRPNPIVGRIYRTSYDGKLKRITREGGAGYWSGRGCTPGTATPENHIRAEHCTPASLAEVNYFLEEEMRCGLAKTVNDLR